jgi:DNA repair protein RadC
MVAEKTNYQLLATLVSTNTKVEDILNQYSHNFYLLTRATYEDLRNLGLTPQEAIRLVAALELFKRAYTTTNVKKISKSSDGFELLKDLSFSKVEIFTVIFLDRANQVLSVVKMFQGGISECAVDIKVILKKAIELGSSSFLCAHNHPSGIKYPSNCDLNLCNDIKNAAKMVQINFIDFLIIAKNDYLSFQDEGIF